MDVYIYMYILYGYICIISMGLLTNKHPDLPGLRRHAAGPPKDGDVIGQLLQPGMIPGDSRVHGGYTWGITWDI